jgi:hypothetical protein
MKRVQVGRRMLRSSEFGTRCFGKVEGSLRWQDIRDIHPWRMQCHVRHREHTRRLRGRHRVAAVVALVRGIARHRTAALHALLV